MKILELFCGTKSIGKVAEARGHEAAPRGSKTGPQGLKGAIDRGVIPYELCKEIITAAENSI